MPTIRPGCRNGFPHYDPDNRSDLIILTRSGAIWLTPYIQKGLDAIMKKWVTIEELRNVPPQIADLIGRTK